MPNSVFSATFNTSAANVSPLRLMSSSVMKMPRKDCCVRLVRFKLAAFELGGGYSVKAFDVPADHKISIAPRLDGWVEAPRAQAAGGK